MSLLMITGTFVTLGQNIDRLYKDALAKFFEEWRKGHAYDPRKGMMK